MPARTIPITTLSALSPGEEADFFALMTSKDELSTREGKPYLRVGFRDARREVQFPIWDDSPWADECRLRWWPGVFYKLRALYRETSYGPQLEIHKIRPATDEDAQEGFDPLMLRPRSANDPEATYQELVELVADSIGDGELRALVLDVLDTHRDQLLIWTAARRNHHAYVGGFLEHALSVARTCVLLADKYDALYPDLSPRLNRDVVIAGGVLHDIGKLRELTQQPTSAAYTPEGYLIGHVLLGRDILREAAARHAVNRETLLRLEHVLVSHERPEGAAVKQPMTPEALLVQYADDLDAKYHMLVTILRGDSNPGPVTSAKNILNREIFRGLSQ
jgi:3'-5' exoribonuclease